MRTLSTTRADSGALTTTTPGRPGGGGLDPLLAAVLQRRMAATPRPGAGLVGGRAPEIPSAPAYRPTMGAAGSGGGGSAPAPARVTRQRLLRGIQDPTSVDAWAGSKALNPGTTIQEYQLPDGSWSGDAQYGTLAGNEQAARQHMDALDEKYRGRGGR